MAEDYFRSDFTTPFGKRIRREGTLREYKAGEAIYRQGETIDGLNLISSGVIGIFHKAADGKMRFLYPAFHGICLTPFPTGRNPSATTAVALSHAYAYHVDVASFRRIISTDPDFMEMVADVVARNFSLAAIILGTRSIESARSRVRAFIQMQDGFQPHLGAEACVPIEKRLSQALLAELLGVTRPYLNRILREVRAEQARRKKG